LIPIQLDQLAKVTDGELRDGPSGMVIDRIST